MKGHIGLWFPDFLAAAVAAHPIFCYFHLPSSVLKSTQPLNPALRNPCGIAVTTHGILACSSSSSSSLGSASMRGRTAMAAQWGAAPIEHGALSAYHGVWCCPHPPTSQSRDCILQIQEAKRCLTRRSTHTTMAANASPSGGAAAPVADAPKSSFSFPEVSMPSFPDASASSPSQALIKAGDVLSSTVTAISSKAGEALGVLGTNYPHVLLTFTP